VRIPGTWFCAAAAAFADSWTHMTGTAARTLRPLIRLDPGWLFLIAGAAVVACTVLIPAQRSLDNAGWERDRAKAIENHRVERLERYAAYLDALNRGDESVLLSLAATQLNMSPEDRVPLTQPDDPSLTSASVFPPLEPPPLDLPPRPEKAKTPSLLERLTIGDTSRLWLMALGLICMVWGLLPAASAVAGSAGMATPVEDEAAS
jgi:hypothetical protein